MATTSTINAAEATRRRREIDAARHSTELEGGSVTAETRADQEAYVAGQITLEQLGARIRGRYGVG